jgi:hypothetical protein
MTGLTTKNSILQIAQVQMFRVLTLPASVRYIITEPLSVQMESQTRLHVMTAM